MQSQKILPALIRLEAIADDLNTSLALSRIHALAKSAKENLEAKVALAEALNFLGFEFNHSWSVSFGYSLDKILEEPVALEHYEALIQSARESAAKTKDFSEVDRIKDVLKSAGLEVRMSKTGVTIDMVGEIDAEKLKALL